jgi:hypothetical protein
MESRVWVCTKPAQGKFEKPQKEAIYDKNKTRNRFEVIVDWAIRGFTDVIKLWHGKCFI